MPASLLRARDERGEEDVERRAPHERTKGLLIEFVRVAESIALHDSKDGARALFKGFEYVLLEYDAKAGFVGSFNECEFDLAKFVGHEAFVIFIALLIREGRWSLIAEVLSEEIVVKNVRGTNTRRFDRVSSHVKLLSIRKDRLKLNRRSLHADILKERHEQGELAKVAPFSEFMEADLFLFLRAQLESSEANSWSVRWAPWSTVFLEHGDPPRYLLEAKRASTAAQLAAALGVPNANELRERFTARVQSMNEMLRGGSPFWDGPFQDFNAAEIGTR